MAATASTAATMSNTITASPPPGDEADEREHGDHAEHVDKVEHAILSIRRPPVCRPAPVLRTSTNRVNTRANAPERFLTNPKRPAHDDGVPPDLRRRTGSG